MPLTGSWAAAWESITGGRASSHERTQKLHELLAQKTHKVNRLGSASSHTTKKVTQKLHELLPLKTHKVNRLVWHGGNKPTITNERAV